MQSKYIVFVYIFFFLLVDSKSYSQSREFVFYPVQGGLISEQLKSISYTDDGIIWGATDNGIMKFDGNTTEFIHSKLPSHYIKSLTRGKDHSIYVIHDLGIAKITSGDNQFDIQPILEGSTTLSPNFLYYPKSIFEVTPNEYWIGETSTIVHYIDNKIKRYTLTGESQSPHYVRSVLFEIDGYKRTWAFSYNVGIFTFDKEQDDLVQVTLPQDLHNIAYVEKVGFKTFWIGGKEGVFEMTVNREGQISTWKKLCDIKDVSSACQLKDKQLMVGTWNDGVYYVDLSKSDPKVRKLHLNGMEDIIDLKRVEGQGIWVTGTESMGLLKEAPFKSIDIVTKHRIVESAKEVAKGRIIISLGDSLRQLEWVNGNWIQTYLYECPERSRVFTLFNDELYIGTYDGHIFKTPLNNNRFEKLDKVDVKGSIISMFVDEENHLWAVGEYDQGLLKLNGDDVTIIQKEVLNGTHVIKGEGTFYIGGRNASQLLSKFNYKTQTFESLNLKFPRKVDQNISINDLLINDGLVYIATTDGCYYFNASLEKNEITLEEMIVRGLPQTTSYKAIAQTKDQAIWLASFNALIRVKNQKVQYFDKTYGLPSNAIKLQGLECDSEGRLWIATEKGLVISDHSPLLEDKTSVPKIRLYTLENAKEYLWDQSNAELPYESNIKLKFDHQFFPNDNVKYQYRIRSVDSTWTLPSKVDELTLLNLTNGNYLFEVKAQQLGYQMSDIASFEFRIITPFYKKSWFYVILFILLTTVIVFLFKRHNKKLKEKGKRLEYLVEMRAKEIATQRTKIMDQQQELYQKKQRISDAEHEIAKAELKNSQLREEKLSELLEQRNKHLTVVTLNIVEKSNFMQSLRKQLKILEKDNNQLKSILKPIYKTLDQSEKTDKDWEEFQHYFEGVHKDFNRKLKEQHPSLTSHDLRHCSLIRLNLSLIECANLLGISQDSLKTSRYRLKKKLELPVDQQLQDYILTFNVNSSTNPGISE